MTNPKILNRLYALANNKKVVFQKEKIAIKAKKFLGVYHSDLKVLTKVIGMNSAQGIELINTNMHEARLLGNKIFKPKD